MSIHKFNFENATEKRAADKVIGHVVIPECDGQVKHPEHLEQHEMLQVLQREALNGNTKRVNEMFRDNVPVHQKKDTIEMIERTLKSFGKQIRWLASEDYKIITVDLKL